MPRPHRLRACSCSSCHARNACVSVQIFWRASVPLVYGALRWCGASGVRSSHGACCHVISGGGEGLQRIRGIAVARARAAGLRPDGRPVGRRGSRSGHAGQGVRRLAAGQPGRRPGRLPASHPGQYEQSPVPQAPGGRAARRPAGHYADMALGPAAPGVGFAFSSCLPTSGSTAGKPPGDHGRLRAAYRVVGFAYRLDGSTAGAAGPAEPRAISGRGAPRTAHPSISYRWRTEPPARHRCRRPTACGPTWGPPVWNGPGVSLPARVDNPPVRRGGDCYKFGARFRLTIRRWGRAVPSARRTARKP